MTLAELIVHLQALAAEPELADLPVYLGDWNEQYAGDSLLGHVDIAVAPAVNATWRGRRDPVKDLPRRIRLGAGAWNPSDG